MTTPTDHYPNQSINELSEIFDLIRQLRSKLPLVPHETTLFDAIQIKIETSVGTKRNAEPLPIRQPARKAKVPERLPPEPALTEGGDSIESK